MGSARGWLVVELALRRRQVGNPAPRDHCTGQSHSYVHCPGARTGPASQDPRRSAVTPRHSQFEGTAKGASLGPLHH